MRTLLAPLMTVLAACDAGGAEKDYSPPGGALMSMKGAYI
jgi:hypothetical protein